MRKRRWVPYVAIVAVYVAIAVIARMWVQAVTAYTMHRGPGDAVASFGQINHRMQYENERLRVLTLRDSLVPLLPKSAGLYMTTLRGRAEADSLNTLIAREAGAHPKASINVVSVPVQFGTHPQVRENFVRRLTLSGVFDGAPYCVIALPGNDGFTLQDVRRGGVLGECAFWSRYGRPGAGIQRWLERGGDHFAGSAAAPASWDVMEMSAGKPAWGLRKQNRWFLPLAGQACLAGDFEQCQAAIIGDTSAAGEQSINREWDVRLAFGERTMLNSLEREFGTARFEQFWTSAEPFEQAFENSFGVPLGVWVHRWIGPVATIHRGARLTGNSILLSLLFLGLCVGAVLATAQRRRV